jgi:hypothetical protein
MASLNLIFSPGPKNTRSSPQNPRDILEFNRIPPHTTW